MSSYSLHTARRRVCTVFCCVSLFTMPSSEAAVRANNTLEWQLPSPACTATKFKLQEPLILYGVLAAWVSTHKAGPTMWLHCPGHSAEQENDSVQPAMSSLEQHCSLSVLWVLLSLPLSLPGEVCPSQYSLTSRMSHWVTGISRGTLKIATCCLVNPPLHTHSHKMTH